MTSRPNTEGLLEQVLRLPRAYQMEIPSDFMDANGHMNVMHYTGVGNMAIRHMLANIGMPIEMFRAGQRGVFALKQVLTYLSEIREEDQVAVHAALVDFDTKRIHYMLYVVNLTHNRVASSDERLAIYMDLNTRRPILLEPETLEKLAEARALYAATGWQPDLSGVIQLKH